MEVNVLQLKRALRTVLIVLMLNVAGMGNVYAYQIDTIGDIIYMFGVPSASSPIQYPYPAAIVIGHKNGTLATGSLNIPDSVPWLGHENSSMVPVACIAGNAFAGCSGLTSLTIPNSVEEILYGAFKGCSGLTGNLVIPNSVLSIGPVYYGIGGVCPNANSTMFSDPNDGGAFEGCSGFTGSLIIPDLVTSIGSYAFYNCSGLTGDLTIGNSVTTIGDDAFGGCDGLRGTLTIGQSLQSLEFHGSLWYEHVIVAPGNPRYDSRSNCDAVIETSTNTLVAGCKNSTIPYSVTTIGGSAFCGRLMGSLIIPNSVTTIGANAFSQCSGLTGSLIIPNSVTTIGAYAFSDCSGFTGNLIIGNSVSVIEIGTFSGCSGFKGELVIPKTVTVIGLDAFSNCNGFSKVSYNAANCLPFFYSEPDYYGYYESWRRTYEEGGTLLMSLIHNEFGGFWIGEGDYWIGEGEEWDFWRLFSFYNCGGVLEIGDEVQTIPLFMFTQGAFSEVRIHSSVSSIGDWAFYGCNNVTRFSFNATNCVYYFRTRIKKINEDGSYNMIRPYPFMECRGTLEIGDNVLRINDGMFSSNDFTGSLIIPFSVSEIGISAFSFSDFDGTLTLSNSLTSIGINAFLGCIGFAGSLIIPNSVTSIGKGAFSGCSGFTGDLLIPESATSIGASAFWNCSGFSKVHFNPSHCSNNEANYDWNEFPPFEGCGGSLEISENMEDIPAYLFKKAHFKEITMYYSGPSILHNTIGAEAFAYCDSLQSIVCWNEEPPVLGEGVFAGVNKDNVIVHVPCGKAPTYKLADGWEEFPNYEMHLTAWLLTVTSNEPEHCETQIKQLPLCESGEAIVRAKPAPGYRFLGWYENDEWVSQDTVYTFYLGTSRELVARVRSIAGLEDVVTIEANVYPNPTNGHIIIEAENIKLIRISNMLGQVIYEGKASGNEFEYDFGKHSPGLYLIRIEAASGMAIKKVSVTQ